ncbi:MAG: ABC transporter substrate-binding protein [Chloroflexi bacterium]|nr:ABC transporter substrate-binding protein [Chloroflexota bacterium]
MPILGNRMRAPMAVLLLGVGVACSPATPTPAASSGQPAAPASSAPAAAQASPGAAAQASPGAAAQASPAAATQASPAAATQASPSAAAPAQPSPAAAAAAQATASPVTLAAGAAPAQAAASCTGQLRKITLGVAVAPPNVVHTSPFVARGLGIFAKHCIDANIVQFEGGLSQTSLTAVAQGAAMGPLTEAAIGSGLKGKQVWGMAPRLPQAYMVGETIKTAADLKGKRLSAAGGGVGSFNWVMGREVLKTAGLTVDDVQFISQGTAGRLPGLVSGQLEGVALHPEDVFLARTQKPGTHVLVNLAELLPLYYFNAYGVSDDFLARDRVLVRDTVASLIEANRAIYQDKASVVPIMVQATEKPQESVDYAYDTLTKACVWSVNTGYVPERTAWTVDNAIANGDIPADKKPPYEQIVDRSLGEEALAQVGGTTTINGCSE